MSDFNAIVAFNGSPSFWELKSNSLDQVLNCGSFLIQSGESHWIVLTATIDNRSSSLATF